MDNQYKNGQFGAIRDPKDERDLSYDKYVMGAKGIEIDWDKGFDIRNVLGGDIKIKNQKDSMSCVGQGVSYYVWVKQIIEMIEKYSLKLPELVDKCQNEVDEVSAKAIYSQIFLKPSGGAYIRSGMKLIIDWGSVFEHNVSSLNNGEKTEEEFMRDKSWFNEKMNELAKTLKGKEYRVISAANNMDLFAQAIMKNHGVVGGVQGQSGKGWNTENPQSPDSDNTWGHCIYYGAFGKDELGKFIATPNSWGKMEFNKDYIWKPGDKPGAGWQKLRENYFNNYYQFNPWTYVDKKNTKMANVKIIKDENSSSVGIWIPALSEESLKSYCLNFGIEIPKLENGEIDWGNFINGTLKLK